MNLLILIWDFDGTLAYRESPRDVRGGGAWTASLFETLQAHAPACPITPDQLRPYIQTGFPWHNPREPHPHLASPEAWWAALEPLFARAYRGVGCDPAQAEQLAKEVRPTYLNPERWRRYDDAVPALEALSAAGWTHVILSNHVPELPDLVDAVGLGPYVARIFNSAVTGYEKPHPEAFRRVIEAYPDAATLWMIGDSYRADVLGAQRAGLLAILVRNPHPQARYYAETLTALPDILNP